MKLKQFIFPFLFFLAIIGIALAVRFWPRNVPFDQCSEVYKTYANSPGIKASYIKDFCINDTVSVDVTLLEATDTIGWNTLKRDFPSPKLDPKTQKKIDDGKDLIFTQLVNENNFLEPADPDSPKCDLRATSVLNHTICVFHVTSFEERHAVIYYNLDKSIKKIK